MVLLLYQPIPSQGVQISKSWMKRSKKQVDSVSLKQVFLQIVLNLFRLEVELLGKDRKDHSK